MSVQLGQLQIEKDGVRHRLKRIDARLQAEHFNRFLTVPGNRNINVEIPPVDGT
jgi:hypothetical protein